MSKSMFLVVNKDNRKGVVNTERVKSIDEVKKSAPVRMRSMVSGYGALTIENKEILFYLLSGVPESMSEYWAASYLNWENLAVSIPENKTAAKYLYYTLLHEVVDTQQWLNSMVEAEKYVVSVWRKNNEDMNEFLEVRIWFFNWVLMQNTSPENANHREQIQLCLNFLKAELEKIRTII